MFGKDANFMKSRLMAAGLTGIMILSGNAEAWTQLATFNPEGHDRAEEILFGDLSVAVASFKEESPLSVPANVYVITGREMADRGYKVLLDLFPDLPGVTLINREGLQHSNTPVIRGNGENRKLKYLLNGMPIDPRNGFGTVLTERFPVSNIKQVEFLTGPYASKYGRNTFSGVINIVTYDGKDVDGGRASLLYGTYNQTQVDAIVGKKYGKYDFFVSAFNNRSARGRDMVKEYPDQYSVAARIHSKYLNRDVNFPPGVSTEYYMPWNNSDVYFRVKHGSGMSYDLSYNSTKYPKPGNAMPPSEMIQTDETMATNVTLNTHMAFQRQLTPRLYTNSSVMFQSANQKGKNGYKDGRYKWYAYEFASFILMPSFTYKAGERNEIDLGISYERIRDYPYEAAATAFNPPFPVYKLVLDDEYTNVTLQDKIRLSDSMRTVVGLMYEHSTVYDDVVLPRFSFMWDMSDKLFLKFLYGSGYLSNDPLKAADRAVVSPSASTKGVRYLDPEKLSAYDLNFLYLLSSKSYVSYSVYYNDTRDAVIQVPLAGNAQFGRTWRNEGKRKIWGSDMFVKHYLPSGIHMFAGISALSGEYRAMDDTGTIRTYENRVPGAARYHIKGGVNVPLWDRKLDFYIHDLLVGERWDWPAWGNTVGGYNIVDLHLKTTDAFSQGYFFAFGVRNALDRKGFDAPDEDAAYTNLSPIRRRYFNIQTGFKF